MKYVCKIKYIGRTSVRNQPSVRRPPGFKGVPVALHGASCFAFFDPISFENGQGGSIYYLEEVSSSLDNFHIMEKLISSFRYKHLHLLDMPILKFTQNNQG